MRKGNLIVNDESGRMDIRFGLDDYYGGLHCGECMEVLIDDGIVNISAVCKPPKSLKRPITVFPPLVSYML